jgi:hypothetical protein
VRNVSVGYAIDRVRVIAPKKEGEIERRIIEIHAGPRGQRVRQAAADDLDREAAQLVGPHLGAGVGRDGDERHLERRPALDDAPLDLAFLLRAQVRADELRSFPVEIVGRGLPHTLAARTRMDLRASFFGAITRTRSIA